MSSTGRLSDAARSRLVGALFSLAVLAVYLATLAPGLSGGDSGELIAVSYRLGVAHPPGYPLYTMLGHVLTLLPWRSIAARVNLGSALCGAAAAWLLFVALERWLRDRWAALAGAGLFAFSPLVWRYSVVAEVFALNNLLLAALVLGLVRFWDSRDPRHAAAIALVVGLIGSHHHSLVFIVAPIVLAVLWHGRARLLAPRPLLAGAALVAVGLTPYLYLPWAASHRRIVSWGDPTTFSGLVDHVLRREYGTFQLSAGEHAASLAGNLLVYASDCLAELLYVGAALAVWGVWRAVAAGGRGWTLARVLLVAFGTYTLVFHALSNLDPARSGDREILSRFWQAPNLLLCAFAALALADLAARLGPGPRRLVPFAAIGLVALQIATHYRAEDASRETTVQDFGEAMLASLPPNALYLMRGDVYVDSVRYLQACEGRRTDVAALPLDLLGTDWMVAAARARFADLELADPGEPPGERLRRTVEGNTDRPTYVGIPLLPEEVRALAPEFEVWNVGFANLVLPAGASFGPADYRAATARYRTYEPPGADAVRGKPWARWIRDQYWAREQARCEWLSLHSTDSALGVALVGDAALSLERLIREDPDAPLKNYRTLGFAYSKLAPLDDRYRRRLIEVLETYLRLAPDDPDAPQIRAVIDRAIATR